MSELAWLSKSDRMAGINLLPVAVFLLLRSLFYPFILGVFSPSRFSSSFLPRFFFEQASCILGTLLHGDLFQFDQEEPPEVMRMRGKASKALSDLCVCGFK